MASSKLCSTLDRRVVPALSASDAGFLPLDAMYEILLRLPAKDLCRLRAVCRPWRSLLSDSQFIAAHGARHPGPLIIASFHENDVEHASLVEIMDLSGQSIKRVPREKGDWCRAWSVTLSVSRIIAAARADCSTQLLVLCIIYRKISQSSMWLGD